MRAVIVFFILSIVFFEASNSNPAPRRGWDPNQTISDGVIEQLPSVKLGGIFSRMMEAPHHRNHRRQKNEPIVDYPTDNY